MGHLSLAFLGSPEVRHGGRPLTFATRKALALLAYLVVEGGAHSREKLAALLWPNSDTSHARTTLRSTLAFLRDALGDAALCLRASRETLAFDQEAAHDCDVRELIAAAQAARALASAGQDVTRRLHNLLPQLSAASARYRGDFLDGLLLDDAPEFDDWAALQREALHRAASQVFETCARLQLDSGTPAEAIETLGRWLAHDRLAETAYLWMIECYGALGNRPAALQVYETYRHTLERELGASPALDLAALAARIRDGSWRGAHPRGVAPAPAHSQRLLSTPFVGRKQQHLALTDMYGALGQGGPRAAIMLGEPGIGKTRLADEFLAWASAHGATLLRGKAYEASGRLPYQPVVAALRARLQEVADPRSILNITWLAELCRLLPELADAIPQLPSPLQVPESEAPTRLFEAVVRLTQSLARERPLVVFVDDLQWADLASLSLLAYVARRWAAAGTPALLLLAVRSEELGTPLGDGASAGTTLEGWLADLTRDLPVLAVRLEPLTREDTGLLLRSLLDDQRSPQLETLRAWLYDETRGQPFYMARMLDVLLERGALRKSATGAWELHPITPDKTLPLGIRNLIQARLARLSVPALLACSACAVLGDGCAFEQVRDVSGLPEVEALDAIEELLRRGLVRERDSGYDFAHDKLREVAYAELSATRRRMLHRRSLQTLEQTAAPAAQLAYHAIEAGLRDAAFRYSLVAADAAMAVFAVRNAIGHYERARDLDPAAAAGDPQIALRLGRAYEFVSEWRAAHEVYNELLGLARQHGWAEAECDALNRLATVAAQGFFELGRALGLLAEAQALATRVGDSAQLAETEWNMAQINFYCWNLDHSLAHGRRALGLALELGLHEIQASSHNIVAYSLMMLGAFEEALVEAKQARLLFAKLGNRAMEADCLSIMALIQTHSGHVAAGVAAGHEGMAISREAENPWGEANCAHPLVRACLDSGAWAEALAVARNGLAAARTAGHAPTLVFNLLALGAVYRAHHDLEAARAAHGEAHAIAQKLQHPLLLEWSALELMADAVASGEWELAYQHVEQALAIRNYRQVYVGMSRWLETETLVRSGAAERAAEDLRRAAAGRPALPRDTLQYLRASAVLSAAGGDPGAALAQLEQVGELADRLGLLYDRWQVDQALATFYAGVGDAPKADHRRASAAAIARRIAQSIDDEELRERFLRQTQLASSYGSSRSCSSAAV